LTSFGSNANLVNLVDASLHPMARSWADMTFQDPDTLATEGRATQRFLPCPPAPRLRPTGDPLVPLPTLRLPPSWPSMYAAAPSPVHPASIGVFCDAARPWLPAALRVELGNFVGWFLQLIVAGPQASLQFRSVLQRWQLQLRGRCWQYRLGWNEAYVLFGADVL